VAGLLEARCALCWLFFICNLKFIENQMLACILCRISSFNTRSTQVVHILYMLRCAVSYDLQEKRKRDAGMQSRGKSTVEEEKRIARQFGVYSGFD
jgi:hypothetical protein